MPVKSLCVFCGSSMGASPHYREAAEEFARTLIRHEIDLVYGGSDIGLMGTVARTMLDAGCRVTGIIPRALHEAVDALDVTDLIVVETMHQRKAAMYERSDAFTALPGGIGTFEELLEVYTWSQLGYHEKPVSMLNVGGYYDLLLQQIRYSVQEGFISASHGESLIVSDNPDSLISALHSYTYSYRPKWIN